MEQMTYSQNLPLQRKAPEILACMLIISLILHGAIWSCILLPGRSMVQGRGALYVDLSSMTAPSPQPAPSKPADTEPARETEPLPAEENIQSATESEAIESSSVHSTDETAGRPEALHSNSIGLGISSGYFGSFSEGESLKPEIREYYFALMRRINEVWWSRSAENPAMRGASFVLLIGRDGKIISCDPLAGSGNPGNDRALLQMVRLAEPLPPLPQSFTGQHFTAPIRFVPPLNLMLPGLARRPVPGHG